jgi:IMP dehydrogenase
MLNFLRNIYLNNRFEISYGFEDIAIQQQKNLCSSRLGTDISSEIIRGVKISIPLIASNMSTVVNSDFYIKIHNLGGFAFLHRAFVEKDYIEETKKIARQCIWVVCSIGIGDDQIDLSKNLIKNGCNIVVIDIAHGFSDRVIEVAKKVKEFSSQTKVVIGNTINPEFACRADKYADALKVGIAQGMACETYNMTGCTEKQFSAILKFKKVSKKLGLPIIGDGGIREPGDFVKAVAGGSSGVMAGSIFARCPESASETTEVDGVCKKIYAGMSSRYVQTKWKNGVKSGTCVEGKTVYLDIGENIEKLLERYAGALRSGLTYSGARNIIEFQNKCKFILLK